MPTGTVKAVKSTRQWNSAQYGDFVDYVMDLESGGRTGEVYMTRKPDSPAPTIGETFDYEVAKNDNHGIKIKKVDANASFSNNGGGGSSRGTATDESIERQVAAKCSAQVIAGAVQGGKMAVGDSDIFIPKLTQAFALAIAAKAPAESPPPAAQNDAPADTSDFGAPASGTDDDIPF
jgi:hypothetical protein